jgi:hypothetical protein
MMDDEFRNAVGINFDGECDSRASKDVCVTIGKEINDESEEREYFISQAIIKIDSIRKGELCKKLFDVVQRCWDPLQFTDRGLWATGFFKTRKDLLEAVFRAFEKVTFPYFSFWENIDQMFSYLGLLERIASWKIPKGLSAHEYEIVEETSGRLWNKRTEKTLKKTPKPLEDIKREFAAAIQ